jgi:hypothetical protein
MPGICATVRAIASDWRPDCLSSWFRAAMIETASPVPTVITMIASWSRRICRDSRSRPHRRGRPCLIARLYDVPPRAPVSEMNKTFTTKRIEKNDGNHWQAFTGLSQSAAREESNEGGEFSEHRVKGASADRASGGGCRRVARGDVRQPAR